VGSLFAVAVMILTVAGSVVLGISLAYTSVLALLHAFASHNQAPKPALVLVHSESHVGAD
jgi:ABC-type Na+ efflux pump permease subunit